MVGPVRKHRVGQKTKMLIVVEWLARNASPKSREDNQSFHSTTLTGARVWVWAEVSWSSFALIRGADENLEARVFELLDWVLAAVVPYFHSVPLILTRMMKSSRCHSRRARHPSEKLATSKHFPHRQAAWSWKIVLDFWFKRVWIFDSNRFDKEFLNVELKFYK